MLQHAFKEWAVICAALAQGRQAIILRKGGIDEDAGAFSIQHTRFWLYPTYVHQQQLGVNEETRPLLHDVETARSPAGTLRLQHWAEVTAAYRMRDLLPALLLAHLHCWSEEAVRKRFDYKVPGLTALAVRVYRSPSVHAIPELAAYDGCRSWVDLGIELATEGSSPVLSDSDYHIVQKQLDLMLSPTAYA